MFEPKEYINDLAAITTPILFGAMPALFLYELHQSLTEKEINYEKVQLYTIGTLMVSSVFSEAAINTYHHFYGNGVGKSDYYASDFAAITATSTFGAIPFVTLYGLYNSLNENEIDHAKVAGWAMGSWFASSIFSEVATKTYHHFHDDYPIS